MDIEKSVFISYRRETSTYQARAVYQALKALGYDPFLDYETIDSGAFERVILNQIAARAHFVLLLAPGTLDRSDSPGDWLRREVEHAIDLKRNIVALMFGGFDMGEVPTTGKFAKLRDYNALPVYPEYFDAAIERLATRFLNVPLDAVLHPAPAEDADYVQHQQAEIEAAPPVTENQLEAEKHLNKANMYAVNGSFVAALEAYTEALRLDPDNAVAYNNRGNVQREMMKLSASVADFSRALEIDPDYRMAYLNRGRSFLALNQIDAAVADFDRAVALDPAVPVAHSERGFAHMRRGDIEAALRDYSTALDIDPDDPHTLNNRAWTYYESGQYGPALDDANRAIALELHQHNVYDTRGWIHLASGDPAAAKRDFYSALELNPDAAWSMVGRALARHALGDDALARADLQATEKLLRHQIPSDHTLKQLDRARALIRVD